MKGQKIKFTLFNYTITIIKTVELELSKKTTKATGVRVEKAKQKIIDAVKDLQEENKNITQYAVAKKSGVSINTIRKYKKLLKN